MLLGLIFLLIVGGGTLAADATLPTRGWTRVHEALTSSDASASCCLGCEWGAHSRKSLSAL